MSMRMLIDARHREETRVAVVKGNRIEEFDFESEEHKQLKGNIYLAKVTRVEPSLQAAFVDYGGNRHGFLAFSEIHPDYYQIPKEDRDALLREEAEHAAAEEALRAAEEDEGEDDGDVEGDEALDDRTPVTLDADEGDHDEDEAAPAPAPKPAGGDDHHVESLRQRRMNLRRRYKIQDVIHRRQVLLVQVVKEERGNKGAALTTYLSLAGRYCVLMPNTSHGGGISRKISNASDRKRLKSILSELNLPRTMGCIVRTAGLQRTRPEIKRDFDYLARLWDEIREKTLHSSAPAEIYRDSDLVKRAIRDIYNKDIDEVIVEGEDGYRAARSFMKLLMPSHAQKIVPYSDAVPLFQRFGVEDQLAAMYQPVVQLKSGGYIVINPTEALVSIDINSGRSTREHNIEQTATATNLEAAAEIARQLRLRDMAGLIVIDFIDMENSSNNRKVERAIKEALKNDRARIQVGRISGFGLFEMSRQRLRTGMLEASTRVCHHCEGSGFIRTASSSGLHALRLLEEEAARGRGSRLCLRASQEAALYVLNRKRAELAEIEDRYGVEIEVLSDGAPEGARMSVESGGPPPSHAPRLPAPIVAEPDEDEVFDEIVEDEDEAEEAVETAEREGGEAEGDGHRRRRRRRRRGGRHEEGGAASATDAAAPAAGVDDVAEASDDVVETGETILDDEPVDEDAAEAGGEERRRRGRRGRRGGRRRERGTGEAAEAPAPISAEEGGAVLAAPVTEAAPVPLAEETPVSTAPAEDAPDASAEQPEPAPKPRRRPRARAASAEASAAEPVVAPVPVTATEEAAPAEAKPRRGRKPRAAAVAEPAAAETAAPAEEAPAPAPAPRGRRRKAAPSAETAAVAETPGAEENGEPSPTATELVAAGSEPGIEAESVDGASAPRRGWWQRTFGA